MPQTRELINCVFLVAITICIAANTTAVASQGTRIAGNVRIKTIVAPCADLLNPTPGRLLTMSKYPVTSELDAAIEKHVDQVNAFIKAQHEPMNIVIGSAIVDWINADQRNAPDASEKARYLRMALYWRRLRQERVYQGLRAHDGLARLNAFREALGLETQVSREFRRDPREIVIDQQILAKDNVLQMQIKELERQIRSGRQHIAIDLETGAASDLSSRDRIETIANALDEMLPGTSVHMKEELSQYEVTQGEVSYIIDRNLSGRRLARLKYTVAGGAITDIDINVSPEFQRMGMYQLLTAQMLAFNPQVKAISTSNGKDNFIGFWRALPQNTRDYLSKQRMVTSDSLSDEHREVVLAALKSMPTYLVKAALGIRIRSFVIYAFTRPDGRRDERIEISGDLE